ncbi:MAG: BamA/TamA family outer membrane protein [Parachlamydiales bacterium]|nr:BamA/TamA family outer membrane protein [Parachlamydiales bacterium]
MKSVLFASVLYLSLFSQENSICIKGILLQSPETSDETEDVSGVVVRGLDVPGQDLMDRLCQSFINCNFTKNEIDALKGQIFSYYREQGKPFVAVEIPEQEVSHGILRVVVVEGKIDGVICSGNRWISDRQVLKAIDAADGEAIDTKMLLNNTAWFNRNPFHTTDLLFDPGAKQGTTTLHIETKDRFPLRPYIGGDNTGVSEVVGRARYFGGFNLSNSLTINDVFSFQYTASSDFSELQSYTLHHTIPLPWQHLFIWYGGYASNHPGSGPYKGMGHSAQASGRYTIPIKPLYESALREVTFGFDWKYTNNNLQYVDFFPFIAVGSNVNLGQFMASFDYGNTFSVHKISFSMQAFASFGHYLPHQSDSAYQKLRYKAKSTYFYGKMAAGDLISLPKKWTLSTLLRLQLANANLLPSEEFGLGGYDTVRGYDERELNVDNALCANLELGASPIEFQKWGKHRLKFLAFIDYGLGNNVSRLKNEPFTRYLLGVGGGLRYTISEYFSSRLDYGFKLHKLPFGDTSLGKLHVGMILSY